MSADAKAEAKESTERSPNPLALVENLPSSLSVADLNSEPSDDVHTVALPPSLSGADWNLAPSGNDNIALPSLPSLTSLALTPSADIHVARSQSLPVADLNLTLTPSDNDLALPSSPSVTAFALAPADDLPLALPPSPAVKDLDLAPYSLAPPENLQNKTPPAIIAPPAPPPVYADPTDHEFALKKYITIISQKLYVTDDARVDRLGEELADDSDVWPTYISTAAAHDAEMVDGWNKNLDVLLIFVSFFDFDNVSIDRVLHKSGKFVLSRRDHLRHCIFDIVTT
jgi:hypothetical protein